METDIDIFATKLCSEFRSLLLPQYFLRGRKEDKRRNRKARIRIAEDDDSMRGFLARALERAGYEVESAPDGLAAEQVINTGDFDLLIADIVMPGMDGVELARRACLEKPELRVMFITGFAAVALKARESAPKETRILSKPFHLRELVDQVREILAA